ncbi:hypothetical protein FB192DRAFT_1364834 [Mucor lusitanicus]|uniref:Secreted protein n=1 Tax=Mucor circinelloides f. lusitanicus TaxID=29924 RepID=A0A8H4BQZ5_MUCCL|nr:hypothetical protein FB192DRAFT_1364834 [Mucor lusitanicus]
MYTCSMGLLLCFLFLYHSTVRHFACFSFLLLCRHVCIHLNTHTHTPARTSHTHITQSRAAKGHTEDRNESKSTR